MPNDEWQEARDAESDREYLMGGGIWHDEQDFIAHRPRFICWQYLWAVRRRPCANAGRARVARTSRLRSSRAEDGRQRRS